jgi:hypothetical protein
MEACAPCVIAYSLSNQFTGVQTMLANRRTFYLLLHSMLMMASDVKSIPFPKSSAKAVNRGGRPRKFPPDEAKERKAAAQKQNRGPKASRPAPGTS